MNKDVNLNKEGLDGVRYLIYPIPLAVYHRYGILGVISQTGVQNVLIPLCIHVHLPCKYGNRVLSLKYFVKVRY